MGMKIRRTFFLLACLAAAMISGAGGCERKEKIIDIETPGIDVEVERNKDTGKVDVEVDRKKRGDN